MTFGQKTFVLWSIKRFSCFWTSGTYHCCTVRNKLSQLKIIQIESPSILFVYYSTIFFSWTTLRILLKFVLCHFDDYDDYLEHFQLLTSILLQLNAIKKIIKTTTHHFATTIKLYD